METIKLDAFNTNLHGCRILCQGPFPKQRLPPIMESVQNIREPFKKKILLSHTAFGISAYLSLSYDTVFQMKDAVDWTLLLTYVTYAPKPILIVSENMVIPDGLWPKLPRQTTFVHFTNEKVKNVRHYDAVFFAPMEELSNSYTEYVHTMLQSLYSASYSMKEHREIIQELRVASAGLAWTKEEETKSGCVCWYDPMAAHTEKLTGNQIAELLHVVAEQVR